MQQPMNEGRQEEECDCCGEQLNDEGCYHGHCDECQESVCGCHLAAEQGLG
jgi:hypothetical protein